tara:strand:+ start:2193 stop:2426 length:234 start_codon:yes stop_codon:yes gene_type:complete
MSHYKKIKEILLHPNLISSFAILIISITNYSNTDRIIKVNREITDIKNQNSELNKKYIDLKINYNKLDRKISYLNNR